MDFPALWVQVLKIWGAIIISSSRSCFKKSHLKKHILRRWTHWTNGSPVKSGGQLHMGLWLTTLQVALNPHEPGQGSTHFWLLQACVRGQSELTMHSGLQVGGVPKNPNTQEQTGWPLISLQTLFGPHGEGEHGFPFMVSMTMTW